MSSASTVSETTSLRRSESQTVEDVSSAPLLLAQTRDVEKRYQNSNRNANNINIDNNTHNSFGNATRTATTAVEIANCNNNINIEVHLDENATVGSPDRIMDTNKRILWRVTLDALILLCVGAPILYFYLWGDPYKRGFFCDDESLKHPFKNSTVKNWMLYIIGLVLPFGVILITEIVRSERNGSLSNGSIRLSRYIFIDYEIPDWMVGCYKNIGAFGIGAAICQLTTDIAKYSIGRLRPHFFAVCQPIMADGSTCADQRNAGIYIENFRCSGDGSTKRMLKEVRLSFPSGHASFTFYAMVYVALYLQARMHANSSKLLRHFLQFLCIMIAWYTALSRISDYKHHWSDVLTGSALGALSALIVANYVSDMFDGTSSKPYVLPRTTQDTQPHTLASNGH